MRGCDLQCTEEAISFCFGEGWLKAANGKTFEKVVFVESEKNVDETEILHFYGILERLVYLSDVLNFFKAFFFLKLSQ